LHYPQRSAKVITFLGTSYAYAHTVLSDTRQISSSQSQNTFLLKTYHSPEAKANFKTEVEALGDLAAAAIVGFYGSFQKDQTYSIIFQYADRTLEDYFRNKPPIEDENIDKIWKMLFSLIHRASWMRRLKIASLVDRKVLST